jgi:hypothetical protein
VDSVFINQEYATPRTHQLSHGNINIKRRKLIKSCRQPARRTDRAGRQVSLEPDAVDRHAVRLNELDQLQRARRLGPAALEVVVVVVQPRGRVGARRGRERERNVRRPDGLVPEALAVRAVLVEGLVDYVPRVAFA